MERARVLGLSLSWLAAAFGLAAGSTVYAGPTLTEALDREREAGSAHSTAQTRPLLELTLAGRGLPREQVPLIAARLGGHGGVRIVAPLGDGAAGHLRLGVALRDDASRAWSFEGSEAVWSLGSAEAYASMHQRHWGPGHAGSLLLDGAASALPSVGWRRPRDEPSSSPWLRWLGPWQGDLFVAQLSGHRQPRRPLLIGMRLEAQATPALRLGASRTLQWGGRDRPQGMRSLLRALAGADNGGGSDGEPGNQLAGFDWRWTLWPAHDLSWYGQVAGEDEAGHLPSRNLVLTGLDARRRLDAGGLLRGFVEWSNTTAGALSSDRHPGAAYRHHVYRQGYTQDGAMLGHPAGGDVELATAGVLLRQGPLAASIVAGRGRALPSAQRFAPGRLDIANAALQVELKGGHHSGLGLWWLRSSGWRGGAAQWWWQYAWP